MIKTVYLIMGEIHTDDEYREEYDDSINECWPVRICCQEENARAYADMAQTRADEVQKMKIEIRKELDKSMGSQPKLKMAALSEILEIFDKTNEYDLQMQLLRDCETKYRIYPVEMEDYPWCKEQSKQSIG